MKKLLFLGGPIFQLPIIERAKKMGLRVGVVDIDNQAPARSVADDFFCASICDQRAVFNIVERYKPNGVICGACDTSVQTAAAVCEKFNLPGNSIDSALKSTNKLLMLEAFVQENVPHPKYQYISRECISKTLPQLPYPLISKPVDSSGSRGINLIKNADDYFAKVRESSKAGKTGDILLEEFLDGDEVSVEVIVSEGIPHVLQVTDKITTGAPHFCEIGHSQPTEIAQSLRGEVERIAIAACRAVGLVNSPAHVEIKLTSTGPVLIELGARMAGDTISTHLIDCSVCGINMSEAAIHIALGEKFALPAYRNSGEFVAIKFVASKNGKLVSIAGKEDVEKLPWIDRIVLFGRVGKYFSVTNSNSDRIGFVIARGETKETALAHCEKAIGKLSIEWSD